MRNSPGIVTDQVQNFIREFGLRESAPLAELRTATKNKFKGFLLLPEAGQFLELLLKLTQAKRTLDIGCFTGYSALVAALAMGKDANVVTFDINEEFTAVAQEYWQKNQVADRIELLMGSAKDSLQKLIAEGKSRTFDASFIDADKANYQVYIDLSHELVRQGGFILLDNVLWSGTTADPETTDNTGKHFAVLTKLLQNDERFDYTLLPVGDGLTLLRKR
jgi:predicted O-methyltransferase YrrM